MNKTIIIQGSSRSNGDTNTIINYLNLDRTFDVVDLKSKEIGHFDYEFKNSNDDFIPLMEEIIEKYDTIIFTTPVYWYAMSGILKVFFDRISDLLKTHKDLGRKLRGKNMALISCSNSNTVIRGFNTPFKESANYLGMNYLGDIHTWVNPDHIPLQVKSKIDIFKSDILI